MSCTIVRILSVQASIVRVFANCTKVLSFLTSICSNTRCRSSHLTTCGGGCESGLSSTFVLHTELRLTVSSPVSTIASTNGKIPHCSAATSISDVSSHLRFGALFERAQRAIIEVGTRCESVSCATTIVVARRLALTLGRDTIDKTSELVQIRGTSCLGVGYSRYIPLSYYLISSGTRQTKRRTSRHILNIRKKDLWFQCRSGRLENYSM